MAGKKKRSNKGSTQQNLVAKHMHEAGAIPATHVDRKKQERLNPKPFLYIPEA